MSHIPFPTSELSFKSAQGRYAALTRDRSPDDPELVEARDRMLFTRWMKQVEALAAQAPPLSAEQRASVAGLLT